MNELIVISIPAVLACLLISWYLHDSNSDLGKALTLYKDFKNEKRREKLGAASIKELGSLEAQVSGQDYTIKLLQSDVTKLEKQRGRKR